MARLTVSQMIRLAPDTFTRNWRRAEGRKSLKYLAPIHSWLTVSIMVNAAPDLFTYAWQKPSATTPSSCNSAEMVT